MNQDFTLTPFQTDWIESIFSAMQNRKRVLKDKHPVEVAALH